MFKYATIHEGTAHDVSNGNTPITLRCKFILQTQIVPPWTVLDMIMVTIMIMITITITITITINEMVMATIMITIPEMIINMIMHL